MKLAIVDQRPGLDTPIIQCFQTVANSPRCKTKGLVCLWDWRDVARRYLRRKLPKFWIYTGGCHIAIHAGPPEHRGLDRFGNPKPGHNEAGACLARIIEINTPSDAREAHKNHIAGQCAI